MGFIMKKHFYLITFFLFIFLFYSCSVSKATLNSYVDPNIDKEPMDVIAIFPAKNTRLAPSEANQIMRKISQSIHQRNPNIKLLSPNEVIDQLNQLNMADDWAYFLDNYNSSGVPDENFLREVGESLNIDCILHGELVNVFQQDGAYGINKGTTRVTVRMAILSTRSGKLLWEASSDGVRATTTTVESAPPIIEAVNLAIDKILENLPI